MDFFMDFRLILILKISEVIKWTLEGNFRYSVNYYISSLILMASSSSSLAWLVATPRPEPDQESSCRCSVKTRLGGEMRVVGRALLVDDS